MQHGGVTRTDLLQFIHPAQGSVTRGREIVTDENFQRMLATQPGAEPPAGTHHEGGNRRGLGRPLGHAADE